MPRNRRVTVSSPSSSNTSTPLCRVFRGLKTTQVISIPSTSAAWRSTIHELKGIYLDERWKECESRCLRLVTSCEAMPVVHGYLLFLIGCCVEMHARNMHQYSAAKSTKMADAAVWLERCKAALLNATDLLAGYEAIEAVVEAPQTPCRMQPVECDDFDASPTPTIKRTTSIRQSLNDIPETNWDNANVKRVEGMTASINKIINMDLSNPYHDETDPFLSISTTNTPHRDYLAKIENWSIAMPRLTPSPLRIRKTHQSSQQSPCPVLPSSLSTMSCVSGEGVVQPEDHQLSAMTKKEDWSSEFTRPMTPIMYDGRDGTTTDDWSSGTESPPYSPTALRGLARLESGLIPRSLSEIIRDCLGDDGNASMSISRLAPIPHSSSAKPLPLCFKPKRDKTEDIADDNLDSDSSSLARLERVWKMPSFNGMYLAGSDFQSLSAVENTWSRLSEEYRSKKSNEQRELEVFLVRVTKVKQQLSSLSLSVQKNAFALRQLAVDIDYNRSSHIKAQKLPASKSYWSFSALPKDIINEKSAGDYDEHRDKPDMRLNMGWAAPGTLLNETKEARIRRLRKGCFKAVGLRNEKRGHKGDEWYSYLCEEALGDIGGFFR